MNADVFIDTNVLLYSIDEDPANAAKRVLRAAAPPLGAVGLVGPGGRRVLRQCHFGEATVQACRHGRRGIGRNVVRFPDR